MNWGGHVYAGGNSATAWLLNNTGVDSVPVPGSLSGLSMNGKPLLPVDEATRARIAAGLPALPHLTDQR